MTSRISGVNVGRFAPHVLAALRIVAAALFLAHGLVKLVGFPGGAPPGEQPLLTLFGLAGVIEVITGMLMILGLFTRSAALVASGEMAVAPDPGVSGRIVGGAFVYTVSILELERLAEAGKLGLELKRVRNRLEHDAA